MCCILKCVVCVLVFFFFNDTATTEIYTLSLHDALPIWAFTAGAGRHPGVLFAHGLVQGDRKSTRLNSSHTIISYAVFCLKKKTKHVHEGSTLRRGDSSAQLTDSRQGI